MKVLYSCYGGAHSSIVAAAIHVGYLPMNRIPTFLELVAVPYYDQGANREIGYPVFMGMDRKNREIYAIGLGPYRQTYTEIIYDFILRLIEKDKRDILVINVIPLLNLYIRVGGFLSRRMGLIAVGKPLTILGVQRQYGRFIKLVKEVERKLD